MIIEFHEVPAQLVEDTLTAMPAEITRESIRVLLSQTLTSWENDHRSAYFDKLKGD